MKEEWGVVLIKIMKYLTGFVFIGFIGMAIFGFMGMISDLEHGHESCIAVAVKGIDCPESNPIAFSSFHIGALKTFSAVIFGTAILILATGLLNSLIVDSFLLNPFSNLLGFVFKEDFYNENNQLISWLSLHEASPHLV